MSAALIPVLLILLSLLALAATYLAGRRDGRASAERASRHALEVLRIIEATPTALVWEAEARGPEHEEVTLSVGGGLVRFGSSSGAEVGHRLQDYHPGGSAMLDTIHRVMRTGMTETVTNLYEVPAGGVRHYVTTFVRVERGRVVGVSALAFDVTDLVERAEQAERRAADAEATTLRARALAGVLAASRVKHTRVEALLGQ